MRMGSAWKNGRRVVTGLVLGAVASLVIGSAAGVAAAGQRTFASLDDAVTALVEVARSGDRAALRTLFGPKTDEAFVSGDPIADREAADRFVERAAERKHLEWVGDDFAVLSVGNDDWPFAIPLMKGARGWMFETEVGMTELKNRRVGRNELDTIQTCQEYVSAQREYARRRAADGGVAEYAQRLRSTPGKRDGLYWEAPEGEDESPIGPFFADASAGGYHLERSRSAPEPFHGYIYKALTAAGPNAPGGARSYIKEGKMTGGFALLAYPVRYGDSGVMTFQVNEQGIVFQKDLGPRTAEIAAKITAYDPNESWDPTD